jgi:hypothetical protein
MLTETFLRQAMLEFYSLKQKLTKIPTKTFDVSAAGRFSLAHYILLVLAQVFPCLPKSSKCRCPDLNLLPFPCELSLQTRVPRPIRIGNAIEDMKRRLCSLLR